MRKNTLGVFIVLFLTHVTWTLYIQKKIDDFKK